MGKKKRQRRVWKATAPRKQEIWLTEDDDLRKYFAWVHKMHPESSIEDTLQSLVDLGFLGMRTTPTGERQYCIYQDAVQNAINKLPPEHRRRDLDLTIHEDTSIICDYDNNMTTLLSLIIKQTDKMKESAMVPWIIKTHEQLMIEVMGIVTRLPETFASLEQRGFIEITENGPITYRYRLNVPAVQAALDALPDRSEGV